MSDRTHYEVIDAEPGAAKADLKAAYVAALEAAQAGGDDQEAHAVRRAWQVLSDPVQRDRYDEEIGVHRRGPASTGAVDAAGVEADAISDETSTGEAVSQDELSPLSPQELRQELFHHVPEFLEQPTLGRRLVASLIDVVTFTAVFSVVITLVGVSTGSAAAESIASLLLFELWVLGAFIVPTVRTGQTLGKRLTYVMCVDRETGNLASPAQLLRRYAVPLIAVPLFPLLSPSYGGLGIYLALFFGLSYAMGRDQLSLADRLAKTVVVVARYKPTRAA